MQTLIGLAILVLLAFVASSRRFWSLRRYPAGAVWLTGGFLAVLTGLLLGPHGPIPGGMFSRPQIDLLSPLTYFCLGWVGMIVGLQAHRRLQHMVPPRTLGLAALDAGVTILIITASAFALFAWLDVAATTAERLMLALLVGACAVGWSPEVRSLRTSRQPYQRLTAALRGASGVGSILALLIYGVGIEFVASGAEHEGGFASFTVALGVSVAIAAVVGLLCALLLRLAGRSEPQFLVVLLGLVSFTAGAAVALGTSPLLVSMFCGAVVVNLPGEVARRLKRVITEAEQPIAMVLMLLAGLLADPRIGMVGTALLGCVLLGRWIVKRVIVGRFVERRFHVAPDSLLPTAPLRQSPLAIVLVIGYLMTPGLGAGSSGLTGEQLLAVIVFTGLISSAAPFIHRAMFNQSEPALTP